MRDGEAIACSRAFIEWYRKFISIGAHELIVRVGERIDDLHRVLPDAATVIKAAMTEANQTQVAEVCAG